jgi:hypothetical protein
MWAQELLLRGRESMELLEEGLAIELLEATLSFP